MTDNDSAGTAAELITDFERATYWRNIADELGKERDALRKQLDEARGWIAAQDVDMKRLAFERDEARAANAQMAAALRQVQSRTYSTDRRCALKYDAVAEICDIVTAALTPASQEAPCNHEWTDARNSVVLSGEICLKCGSIRAGNAASQEAPAHDGCCNCETCIEARSRGPRYKGEGNTPMQKEDYNGSCQ